MLEYLAFENVGPAPAMEVEFAPRVNLITGDNGLGKSFLLDTAWWVLTGAWPAEVNRRMTSGLPARPRDPKQHSAIRFRARYSNETVEYGVGYSPADEAWTPRLSQRILGLVVYAHADGSFSVWDTARNNWPRRAPPVNPERRPPYVFTETEVWDGLRTVADGERTIPLCNGLLHDWSSWLKAKDAESKAMARALRALSPDWDGGDRLEPGPPMRLSIDDARDIPSIRTSYAGAVPILHASSGIRRVAALAYVLTWAWSEHGIAANLRGEETVRQVTMLFDEVESHLHPRWQRSMLRALRDVGTELLDGAELQLIASTHAPLVLASVVRQRGRHAVSQLAQRFGGRDAIPASEFPPYWREVLPELLTGYGRICSYLCLYIPSGTGAPSVDHMVAKSTRWDQVYEWRNYRLACSLMNARKGVIASVLDPFEIEHGWFALELVDFHVVPGEGTPDDMVADVQGTIERLRLNDLICREARAEYAESYWDGQIRIDYLTRHAPFVARELRLQDRLREDDR